MAPSKGAHLKVTEGDLINGRFKVIREVGCGNFSKVYHCIDSSRGSNKIQQPVAVKIVKAEYKRDAHFEKQMLHVLIKKHNNKGAFCRMLDFFEWRGCPVFVMCIYGPSLRDCPLGYSKGAITRSKLVKVAHSLLETCRYIHFDCQMVHTDLKPENILVGDINVPKNGIGESWVICDFGSSSQWNLSRLDSDLITTRPYRAPEVVLGNPWFYPADMWSIGCILFELAAGFRLFDVRDDLTHLQLMEKRLGPLPEMFTKTSRYSINFFDSRGDFLEDSKVITAGKINTRKLSLLMHDDQELCDLIASMLVYDPLKRATAKDALNHKIFKAKCPSEVSEGSGSRKGTRKIASPIAESTVSKKSLKMKGTREHARGSVHSRLSLSERLASISLKEKTHNGALSTTNPKPPARCPTGHVGKLPVLEPSPMIQRPVERLSLTGQITENKYSMLHEENSGVPVVPNIDPSEMVCAGRRIIELGAMSFNGTNPVACAEGGAAQRRVSGMPASQGVVGEGSNARAVVVSVGVVEAKSLCGRITEEPKRMEVTLDCSTGSQVVAEGDAALACRMQETDSVAANPRRGSSVVGEVVPESLGHQASVSTPSALGSGEVESVTMEKVGSASMVFSPIVPPHGLAISGDKGMQSLRGVSHGRTTSHALHAPVPDRPPLYQPNPRAPVLSESSATYTSSAMHLMFSARAENNSRNTDCSAIPQKTLLHRNPVPFNARESNHSDQQSHMPMIVHKVTQQRTQVTPASVPIQERKYSNPSTGSCVEHGSRRQSSITPVNNAHDPGMPDSDKIRPTTVEYPVHSSGLLCSLRKETGCMQKPSKANGSRLNSGEPTLRTNGGRRISTLSIPQRVVSRGGSSSLATLARVPEGTTEHSFLARPLAGGDATRRPAVPMHAKANNESGGVVADLTQQLPSCTKGMPAKCTPSHLDRLPHRGNLAHLSKPKANLKTSALALGSARVATPFV